MGLLTPSENHTIRIKGPSPPLNFNVRNPGSKNVAMPILVAAALTGGNATICRVPNLADIRILLSILELLGVAVHRRGEEVDFSGGNIRSEEVPASLSSELRGSIYTLALPAVRLGRGRIGAVGGDNLAGRSLEPHLRALRGFGLEATLSSDGLQVSGGFPRPSEFNLNERYAGVSATCLALLIAASLEGRSVIRSVSGEPEVDDLLDCLKAFGVLVYRDGRAIAVQGPFNGDHLSYSVPIDTTYCGTMAMAAAITEGTAYITNEAAARMGTIIPVLSSLGLTTVTHDGYLRLSGTVKFPQRVETGEFPAFPSDLVPPLIALLTKVPGESRVVEHVYKSRFDHVPYLVKMGVKCTLDGNEVKIVGGTVLHGGQVRGTGIRETAALLLAALHAHGITEISNAGALARGYEDLPDDLAKAGASVAMLSR